MKLIKKALIGCIIFSSPLLILRFLITQPSMVQNATNWQHKADKNLLKKYVKTLSHTFPERSDDVDKLNVSAEYIYKHLKKYSSSVYYQIFSVQGIEYQNIIANFAVNKSDDLYIVGAHYDSYDGLPGADDNASGVAGVLELARLFSIYPPSQTIQLVVYALEEPPYFKTTHMGSYHHAKSLRDSHKNVTLMISLEMIGYFSEQKNTQSFPVSILKYAYPNSGNFIAVVGGFGEFTQTRFMKKNMRTATPLAVYSINAPAFIPGIDFSDHLNYTLFNFPAIMITDTAFYRNFHYHKKTDTWEKLDYTKMAKVIDGVHQSLLAHMQTRQ